MWSKFSPFYMSIFLKVARNSESIIEVPMLPQEEIVDHINPQLEPQEEPALIICVKALFDFLIVYDIIYIYLNFIPQSYLVR